MAFDILAYFNEHVLDVFLEARKVLADRSSGKSRDLKAVLNSATSLFHYRERVPKSLRIDRAETERRCPDYGIVADMVNAAKHGEINRRTPHGAPYVKDANQIEEQTWITEYEDTEGIYRHSEKVVTLRMSDSSERNGTCQPFPDS